MQDGIPLLHPSHIRRICILPQCQPPPWISRCPIDSGTGLILGTDKRTSSRPDRRDRSRRRAIQRQTDHCKIAVAPCSSTSDMSRSTLHRASVPGVVCQRYLLTCNGCTCVLVSCHLARITNEHKQAPAQ